MSFAITMNQQRMLWVLACVLALTITDSKGNLQHRKESRQLHRHTCCSSCSSFLRIAIISSAEYVGPAQCMTSYTPDNGAGLWVVLWARGQPQECLRVEEYAEAHVPLGFGSSRLYILSMTSCLLRPVGQAQLDPLLDDGH